MWVRLSTESIRQHCQPGWYPLEAWCLQYNQHIDKTLLHPMNETSITPQENDINGFIDNEAATPTPTSDATHHLTAIAPEIIPRKSSSRKNRHAEDRSTDTNPFRDVFKSHADGEYTEAMPMSGGSKSSRLPSTRNPFEKLTKRSGKVIEDTDDLEEYASQDECEKSALSSSISSSLNQYNQKHHSQSTNIGTWTAGVMGGGSSKLQAIQKWFKSESFDGNKENSRKRGGDFTELASVSVRDLVKAIGGNSNDGKGNCNTPHQLSQSSSPISIPHFSKFAQLIYTFLSFHFCSFFRFVFFLILCCKEN